LAPLIGKDSKYISQVDELLTLEGLRIIWERNQRPTAERTAAGTSGAHASGNRKRK
jgi:hypothetical protein